MLIYYKEFHIALTEKSTNIGDFVRELLPPAESGADLYWESAFVSEGRPRWPRKA